MDITTSALLLFSPTGTSHKIASAVADGVRCTPHLMNATYSSVGDVSFDTDTLVFFAVPVYGGKVAPLALKRLDAIRGNHTPAVLMVVYGNRAYEGALVELDNFVRQRGFVPIAAGAFIGEHSYSTAMHNIAAGRPDMNDLTKARLWGKEIRNKLSSIDEVVAIDVKKLKAPRNSLMSQLKFGQFIMQQRRKPAAEKPLVTVDTLVCKNCGKCARLCPTGAIVMGDCMNTQHDLCIKCCACIKGCPAHARKLDTPYASILSKCFAKSKPNVTIL